MYHFSTLTTFLALAILFGTIFLVALIELLLNSRKIRLEGEIRSKIDTLKNSYSERISALAAEKISYLDALAKQPVEKIDTYALEAEYEEKLAHITASDHKQLERAQDKAKKLEAQAKLQADQYLDERKKQVEAELVELVLHVTKKVLPEGLTYSIQKELVIKALQEAELRGNS